jgi:hypothetical protein
LAHAVLGFFQCKAVGHAILALAGQVPRS